MPRPIRRWVLPILVTVLALVAAACSNGGGGDSGGDPIRIGISLPLSGERSEPGSATQQGYEVWEEMVNEAGGILDRPVELVVQDDGSDQNRVRANYQALIDRENVDVLLGTFSSLQNEVASGVAEQREMVFVCPSCGAPELFERNFNYFFFAQPAVSDTQADQFSQWVASLPADQRPKTAAYPVLDDPFATPIIDSIRTQLEAVGITTVYNEAPYAEGTSGGAMDAIANAIKGSGAELVAHGAIGADGIDMVRSMQRVGYNPNIMFQTTAPSLGEQYAEGVGGAENASGIFYSVSWSPDANFEQNQEFVQRYEEKFGGTPPEDAANGFGAAQVVTAAIEGVGEIDHEAMATWLHENTVETVMGPISWDPAGRPQQSFILAQWQEGSSHIVLPRDVANSDEILFPKPNWG